jgi:REP element-mobilizing transposase RayT
MPQSLANVLVHIVFSTKGREAMLRIPDLRAEMHNYLGGISKNLGCPTIIVGGTDDHIHLLGRQARTISLADWIKELKRGSSLWIKTKDRTLECFEWQAGYGAFSVSQSQSGRVERYIAGQQEHHRKLSFQDEFRELLRKHNIGFDERYVWD